MTSRQRFPQIWVAALLAALFLVVGGIGVAYAQEESDGRARVSSVQPIIDDEGQLWCKVRFEERWADKPPRDLFSFFSFFRVQVDGEFSTIGWQIHDGAENVIADGAAAESPKAYILEDGCVLVATGLFPAEPFTATVNAAWGSWVEETTTQTVLGEAEFVAESESADRGNPIDLVGPVVFDLVSGEMITPATTTTAGATTTTAVAATDDGDAGTGTPSTTPTATTEVSVPGGGNTEGGSFSIWIPIVLFGVVVGGFTIYYRTRERPKQPPPVDGGDDDDGDDPRDTPPPAVYGEIIEHPGCGWALYWTDQWGIPQLLRKPGGLVHICCKYYVTVKTSAESAVLKQSRQDGTTERLRLYDAGRDLDGVRIEARAGARSGPAGRQDWMQGLGDPTDQTDVEAGTFRQLQPAEEPPDVSAHVEHWERTTLAVTLEAGCPEYTNLYDLEGESYMSVMATHECTNEAGDPCPVELSATGHMNGAIEGPQKFKTAVTHELGGTPDDLDREQSSTDDLSTYKPRAGHDHVEKDRVTHEFSHEDKSTEVVDIDHLNIVVRNHVRLDAAQIVPEEVWPTTERVTAHLETMINHEVTVETFLKPEGCESNGCCGHGTCGCDAQSQVSLSRFGSSLVVEDKVYDIVRKPKPPGVNEWESWELRPVK